MTIIIGLTGGIASGKSTVAAMLREYHIPVIDADIIAREVVEPGTHTYEEIVKAFGEDIVQENGELNRPKLGSIIFQDEGKRLLLNSIVHPAVRSEMNRRKDAYIAAGEQAVVLDIPLLFESKLTALVEKILLVYVEEEVQLERLMQRNQLKVEEAKARISSQLPLKEKISQSDEVINNNGTLVQTRTQLLHILQKWGVKM